MDARETLASVPLFKQLRSEYLDRLARVVRERTYEPGATILREGEYGIAFFAIIEGHVEVLRSGVEAPINRLGPGESFGELALLSDVPRIATVRAVDQVRCAVLQRLDFLDIVRDQPELAMHLLRTLSELLRQCEERAAGATARS
jgi:CRP-like cAMP-binding protein